MGDVGFDRFLAFVEDRGGAHGPVCHSGPGCHFVLVDRHEPGSIAAVGEAGEHDLAGTRALRRTFVKVGSCQVEATETIEAVAPPRPVVHLVTHRLAEFAVARHVDAGLLLPADDVDDGRLERLLVGAFVGGFPGLAGAVGFNQIVRTRQAPGVTR